MFSTTWPAIGMLLGLTGPNRLRTASISRLVSPARKNASDTSIADERSVAMDSDHILTVTYLETCRREESACDRSDGQVSGSDWATLIAEYDRLILANRGIGRNLDIHLACADIAYEGSPASNCDTDLIERGGRGAAW